MDLSVHPVVSFIDLGTNSSRLLVIRLNPNCSYSVLTQQKEVVRLGEGEFADNYLALDAIERTVTVLIRFAEIARSLGSSEIVAVATSATRDARNREILISRVREEAGFELNVVSGPEEARLIWLGVSSGVQIDETKSLFIDIGGGSTEIIIGDQARTYLLRSLKLGAIRTTNMFVPSGLTGPIPSPVILSIRRHIRGRASHTLRHVIRKTVNKAFGSSGTITSLETVAAAMDQFATSHRPGIITLSELSEVIVYLSSLSLKDRRNVQGLNPDRADIIIGGALILESLLEQAGILEIRVSSRSLRDGLLIDYLSRIPGFPYADAIPVRAASIRQLGRSCHINEPHADHVQRLALSLFDSSRESGLHTISDTGRELLSFAAFLHDVGQFLSFPGHHQHSFYVITHAPLLGFHELEILIIALITRYHRKKMPRRKDFGYAHLSSGDRSMVQVLSLFLRMAENLDRSHDGRVTQARLEVRDRRKVTLVIGCNTDCTLEQWAILEDIRSFERTMKKGLRIEFCPDNAFVS
ncbi:MAG: Ppx/GppA family phosphatase [Methanospirillum sp.]|uniref:Ppx/GppA phosphatase family protein n=1 Tax=Methanospirillum sp. TaxID=45200 RepID=UPI00236D8F99|nr:Ppx/GppA phosphatase family protein [Methanospirillum sp.]MDD1727949.1 Ppx/GppA family phosphatase [Methanospirillum sp.]